MWRQHNVVQVGCKDETGKFSSPAFDPCMTYSLFSARLTLLLSCSMKFNKYPHDEQLCRLSMESSKFVSE